MNQEKVETQEAGFTRRAFAKADEKELWLSEPCMVLLNGN